LVSSWPVDAKLLVVDDNVTFNYFLLEFLDLFFVHSLNFVVSFKICFLKVLELSLELLELTGDSLVFGSERFVLFFERLICPVIFLSKVSQFGVQNTLFLFEIFIIGVIFLSFLLQDF
jgi:hypothetical protein